MYLDRRCWSVTTLTLALLFLPSLAAAQGGSPKPQPGPGGGACHADVQRLCSAAKGQPGGVSSCLRQHLSELSEPCRQQIEQRGAQAKGAGAQVRQSCADELGRFCPDVTKGSGAMMRCLRQHEAELGEACRTALPPRGRGGAPAAP